AVTEIAILGGGAVKPRGVEAADAVERAARDRNVVGREEAGRPLAEMRPRDVLHELAGCGGAVAGHPVAHTAADDRGGLAFDIDRERLQPGRRGSAVVVGERQPAPACQRYAEIAG